jgi:hypothetical protein
MPTTTLTVVPRPNWALVIRSSRLLPGDPVASKSAVARIGSVSSLTAKLAPMYRRSAIKIPFTERQIAPGAPIEALKRVGGTCNFHERNSEWRRWRFEVHSVFAHRGFKSRTTSVK